MKNIFLLFGFILVSFFTAAQTDPVIMTINGENVYKSEFLYIYTKNEDNPSFKKKDLDAYMELFINYKLKVKEAERLKYDTIPALKSELLQYRGQLSLPYMTDKDKNEELIKQAYDRTINEVRASHILIRVNPDAAPADTLEAYQRIMAMRKTIIGGKDFKEVAQGKKGSEDPSVKINGGDLGYFTALQMVYTFEEAAFTTSVGDVSMPIRTQFGYHLIQVTDKRKSLGKINTAHIMILANDNMSNEEQMKAKEKIDEIYALLEGGENFEDLAKKYSDDQSSRAKGGVLPIFGAGTRQRMVTEFETAAFSIPNDGEYCEPVLTPYGWHIIKRISLEPMPTYDEMYRELKLKVERDERAKKSKESFVNGLKKEYNFVSKYGEYQVFFEGSVGQEIFAGNWKGFESKVENIDLLFTFADQVIYVGDFETYLLETQTKMAPVPIYQHIRSKYNEFVNLKLTVYEDTQLEKKHPAFKSLMQEYRDGILVFEIMQNEIWEKAAKDTTGIRNYYNLHKDDFTYPVRYKGDLYKCKDEATAQEVSKLVLEDSLTPMKIRALMNKSSQLNVNLKSHTFNSQTTEAFRKGKATTKPSKKKKKVKARKFKPGLNKIFERNGEFYVFNVDEVLPPRARKFSEAKGLVTAAYQNELEAEWLTQLRKDYTVVVNKEVLYSAGEM